MPSSIPARLLGLAVLLIAPGAALAAAGPGFPTVFVLPALDLPEGASKAGAEAVTAGLYKELSVSVPITLLKDLDTAAAKMGSGAGPSSMPAAKTAAEAKALVDEGKKAKVKEAPKAIEILKGAVSGYEALLAETKDFAGLAAAHLELGDALFRAGFQDEGEEEMKLAVAMIGKPASMAGLDPAYAGLTDKRVKKVAAKAPGKLKLDTAPPGATVLVDGAAAPGPTPFTMDGLRPGVHYVLVTLAGSKPKVERVDIKGNETSELTVALEKEGAAAAGPAAAPKGRLPDALGATVGKGIISTEGRKVLAAFGTAAEAKFVVVPYFVPDGDVFFLRTYMFRVEDGEMVKFDDKTFAALDKMEKGIQNTAETIIKYAYAFPPDGLLDKTASVVVPVPASKIAKTKKTSVIDDDDGGGGAYADDCDPEVDDCPKKIKKTTHKKKKKAARVTKKKHHTIRSHRDSDDDDEDVADDDDDDDGDDKVAAKMKGDDDDDDGGGGGGIHIKLPTNKWYFWLGVGVVGVVVAGAVAGGVYWGTRDGVNALVMWPGGS